MRISRSWRTVQATGGEVANHLWIRESWSDPMVRVGCSGWVRVSDLGSMAWGVERWWVMLW
jgi:hypothetical protein